MVFLGRALCVVKRFGKANPRPDKQHEIIEQKQGIIRKDSVLHKVLREFARVHP